MSQFWPTEKLKEIFKRVRFGLEDVFTHPDKETILLRDEKKKDIPYEDTPAIVRMRELLRDYNRLLERTFVDIPFSCFMMQAVSSKSNSCSCHCFCRCLSNFPAVCTANDLSVVDKDLIITPLPIEGMR